MVHRQSCHQSRFADVRQRSAGVATSVLAVAMVLLFMDPVDANHLDLGSPASAVVLHRRSLRYVIRSAREADGIATTAVRQANAARAALPGTSCSRLLGTAAAALQFARNKLRFQQWLQAFRKAQHALDLITECEQSLPARLPSARLQAAQSQVRAARNFALSLRDFFSRGVPVSKKGTGTTTTKRRSSGGRTTARWTIFGPVSITPPQKRFLMQATFKDPVDRYTQQAYRWLVRAYRVMRPTDRCRTLTSVAGDALLNSQLLLSSTTTGAAGFHQMLLVDGQVKKCAATVSNSAASHALGAAHSYLDTCRIILTNRNIRARFGSSPGGTVVVSRGRSGNPVDDCWAADSAWASNRQYLANCAAGYGQNAQGGANGPVYVVTTTADDPVNPPPGSLRYGVTRDGPLWITFATDMVFSLSAEIMVNSDKTIDGRGANVVFKQSCCLVLLNVSNVVIHGLHFYNCTERQGSATIRVSASEAAPLTYGTTPGNAVTLMGSQDVWIDHCTFEHVSDPANFKFINVKLGSSYVTISNSHFSHAIFVMLLGHSDTYTDDTNLKVTVMLNVFGQDLGQRMPRCRLGQFHILNNFYSSGWALYAVGGSAAPTILSEGNHYVAAGSQKEVTDHMDAPSAVTDTWNWKSRGDFFAQGAFFSESGSQPALDPPYAYSAVPASLVPRVTAWAGALSCVPGAACR